jgi:hypothetical protein
MKKPHQKFLFKMNGIFENVKYSFSFNFFIQNITTLQTALRESPLAKKKQCEKLIIMLNHFLMFYSVIPIVPGQILGKSGFE